ncbi:hypothetical protein BB559_004671 [Furculomyces boomerangus]|uniref:YMC020W-like alpha/beta hydrolase domain-containing protein n=1 Tax=Furculomyces boomerangus TaxID=61424 RepID=A0A2T9YDI7_9FUNG|nr:hypothetical protein BB559_004671 [Furculomyces boomerangus]
MFQYFSSRSDTNSNQINKNTSQTVQFESPLQPENIKESSHDTNPVHSITNPKTKENQLKTCELPKEIDIYVQSSSINTSNNEILTENVNNERHEILESSNKEIGASSYSRNLEGKKSGANEIGITTNDILKDTETQKDGKHGYDDYKPLYTKNDTQTTQNFENKKNSILQGSESSKENSFAFGLWGWKKKPNPLGITFDQSKIDDSNVSSGLSSQNDAISIGINDKGFGSKELLDTKNENPANKNLTGDNIPQENNNIPKKFDVCVENSAKNPISKSSLDSETNKTQEITQDQSNEIINTNLNHDTITKPNQEEINSVNNPEIDNISLNTSFRLQGIDINSEKSSHPSLLKWFMWQKPKSVASFSSDVRSTNISTDETQNSNFIKELTKNIEIVDEAVNRNIYTNDNTKDESNFSSGNESKRSFTFSESKNKKAKVNSLENQPGLEIADYIEPSSIPSSSDPTYPHLYQTTNTQNESTENQLTSLAPVAITETTQPLSDPVEPEKIQDIDLSNPKTVESPRVGQFSKTNETKRSSVWGYYFYSRSKPSAEKSTLGDVVISNQTLSQNFLNEGNPILEKNVLESNDDMNVDSKNFEETKTNLVNPYLDTSRNTTSTSVNTSKGKNILKNDSIGCILEPKLDFSKLLKEENQARMNENSINHKKLTSKAAGRVKSFFGFNSNTPRTTLNSHVKLASEETPLLSEYYTKSSIDVQIHKAAESIKKVVIIGIHGWFPTKLVQFVAGEPTGRSEKFCDKMKSSMLEYMRDEHDIDFDEKSVVLMPLVAEGTIEHRVQELLGQLLCFEYGAEVDLDYESDINPNEYPKDVIKGLENSMEGKTTEQDIQNNKNPTNDQKDKTSTSMGKNEQKTDKPNQKASKAPKLLPIDISVPDKRKRRKLIEQADTVIVVTHSQGTPVSALILEQLIELDIVKPRFQRVGMLAMAGISHGPFPSLSDNVVIKYLEHDAARELFFFTRPTEQIVAQYIAALGTILQKGVRMLCVASWVDEVVPFYSALIHSISHPNLYRAVYISAPIKSSFLTNLAIFSAKIRNAGISDYGLAIHLSSAIAGSIWSGSVSGHSTIYEEPNVYKLMVKWLLYSTSSMPPSVNIREPYFGPLIDDFKSNLMRVQSSMLNLRNLAANNLNQYGLDNNTNSHTNESSTVSDGSYCNFLADNLVATSDLLSQSCLQCCYGLTECTKSLFSRFSLGYSALYGISENGELSQDQNGETMDESNGNNYSGNRFSLFNTQGPHIMYHPFDANEPLNPYFLPWIIRSIWTCKAINKNPELVEAMNSLVEEYEKWVPETKIEKELKYKLEPLRHTY